MRPRVGSEGDKRPARQEQRTADERRCVADGGDGLRQRTAWRAVHAGQAHCLGGRFRRKRSRVVNANGKGTADERGEKGQNASCVLVAAESSDQG